MVKATDFRFGMDVLRDRHDPLKFFGKGYDHGHMTPKNSLHGDMLSHKHLLRVVLQSWLSF